MNRKFLDTLLTKPIEHLKVTKKMPPNKEALKLYREILKFSRYFNWTNKKGELWEDIIRKSARKEYEIAKNEDDPLIIMKMVLTTREAITKTKEKMNDETFKLHTKIDQSRVEENKNKYI